MPQRGIETDHGLTSRMFVVGLLLVVLYGAIMTGLFFVTKSLAIVLVIGVGAIFAQYWFSARIALFSMHAKVVTPEQEPKLHAMVDRLCALANVPKPQVAVSETDLPNAFATGRSPKAAVICATRGIMQRLPDEELEAVLAHELSHVVHRDVAVMTIASSVGMLAGLISRIAMYGMAFGGGGNRNDSGGQLVLIELGAMVVSFLIYIVSWLLTLALSRYRELSADRSGAILIGKPSVLASALQRITGDIARIPSRDLRRVETMNAFFFAPAISGKSLHGLLATHPSLEIRLAKLAELERELGQA
jgi:heat shock protein HtpX